MEEDFDILEITSDIDTTATDEDRTQELFALTSQLSEKKKIILETVPVDGRSMMACICYHLRRLLGVSINVEELCARAITLLERHFNISASVNIDIGVKVDKDEKVIKEIEQANPYINYQKDGSNLGVSVNYNSMLKHCLTLLSKGEYVNRRDIHDVFLHMFATISRVNIILYSISKEGGLTTTEHSHIFTDIPLTAYLSDNDISEKMELCLFQKGEQGYHYKIVVDRELAVADFTDTNDKLLSLNASIGKITSEIAEFIESRSSPRIIRELKSDIIAQLESIKTREEFIIGFFGETGEGKTSLINALLDLDETLPQGGIGACTSTITELARKTDLASEFELIVEFHSKVTVEEEFAKFIMLHEKNHIVDDALNIRIACMLGFQGKMDDKTIKRNYERIQKVLLRADIEKLIQKQKITLRFKNKEEMEDYLHTAVSAPESEGNSDEPLSESIYPIVKRVRIYGNFLQIPEGIVLSDLPGMNDRNSYREQVTKNYINKCSHVFIIICAKNSGLTNTSTSTMIEENLRNRPVTEISVVLTKIDTISNKKRRKQKGEARNELLDVCSNSVQATKAVRNTGLLAIIQKLSNSSHKERKLDQSQLLANRVRVFITSANWFHKKPDLIDYTGILNLRGFLADVHWLFLSSLEITRNNLMEILVIVSFGRPLQLPSGIESGSSDIKHYIQRLYHVVPLIKQKFIDTAGSFLLYPLQGLSQDINLGFLDKLLLNMLSVRAID